MSRAGWWIAGGVAAAGGLGLYLYEKSKPAPSPAIPATTPASTSTNSSSSTTTTQTPANAPPPATNTLPDAPATVTAPAFDASSPAPAVTAVPHSTLTQNYYYAFAGAVPAGISTVDAMTAGLASAGWSNITVLYFGPTGAINYAGGVVNSSIFDPYKDSSTAIFVAQWTGADGQAMPTGVTFWRLG
jgi:hypothetical protein